MRREYNLDRVESRIGLKTYFRWNCLDKGTGEAVHNSAFRVTRGSIAMDLTTAKDSPVLLELISLSLQVANVFDEHRISLLMIFSLKGLQDLIVIKSTIV